jgi:hypothetical protein
MDISGFDEHQQHNFRVALYEIAIHYRDELNFNVNLDTESSLIALTVEKQIANNSFEEAFESLRAMLTDADMTIFMQVDMDMISYPRQMGYIIGATLDIPRIIESPDLENLPSMFRSDLAEAIQESRGTVTVTLPADEWDDASHMPDIDNGQAIMSIPLSFTEQTAFNLSAVRYAPMGFNDGSFGAIVEQQLRATLGTPGETVAEQQLRFRSIAQIATMAAAGLIALTLIIAIIVVVVKKNS